MTLPSRWTIPTLALVVCGLAAAPARAGTYFEQTVTTDADGMNMKVRGWADGPKAKIEFTQSDNPVMAAGTYLLTVDGGETTYLVDPDEETYSVWDRNAAFALLERLERRGAGFVKADFQDPVSEDLLAEPGPEILGYPTTHRRWKSGFTLAMKLAFVKRQSRSVTVTDAWVTDAVEAPGLAVWLGATPPTTGDPELDEYLTREMQRTDGVVLKMTQETTTTTGKGKESRSTTRFELTTLRREPVDPDRFAMPTGYRETRLLSADDG